MVCTKLQSRMIFIPRWISHLCYNSYHFGPLVADTVFGNHYFEMEQQWWSFNKYLREIIDILFEYLSTYLRSPASHCRLTSSRSRTRTASSPSRSSTASPATAASTSASPPTASAPTPPTASLSSRVSTNIFWRSNIFRQQSNISSFMMIWQCFKTNPRKENNVMSVSSPDYSIFVFISCLIKSLGFSFRYFYKRSFD